jgi:hypothetical protein
MIAGLERIWKEAVMSYELLSWNLHRTEKNHENSFKIASDPADIRTEHLTNTRFGALH